MGNEGCEQYQSSWLRTCYSPKYIIIWLCAFAFLQGFVVNGINNNNTSTYERRFGLSSKQASFVSIAYDLAAAAFSLPLTYIGTNYHQQRLIAFAALSMCLGSFIMTIPHYASGLYELQSTIGDECIPTGNYTCMSYQSAENVQWYHYLLLLGMAFNGIGGCLLYSVGIVEIDTMVGQQHAAYYTAILNIFASLGPATGFILGGYVLDIYVDFDVLHQEEIRVTPDSPRWVGAWWLGLLIGSVLFLPISFAFFCYPKKLPDTWCPAERTAQQAQFTSNQDLLKLKDEKFGTSLKDFPAALKLLLSNSAFMMVTIASVLDGLGVAGFVTFMPKIIQTQYGQTSATAAILAGAAIIPGSIGGYFVGGYVIKRFNLPVKGIIKMSIWSTAIAGLAMLVFLVKCDNESIAGVTVAYGNRSAPARKIDVLSSCNSNCGCNMFSYEPVCGADGIQYFTPCHAGCLMAKDHVYYNCSCISDQTAKEGKCPTSCNLVWVFLPAWFLVIFFTLIAGIASMALVLRTVQIKQRLFALGFYWFIIRFFGTVPGPLIVGAIFDISCLIWQKNCDIEGSCWIYSNSELGRNIFFLGIVIKIVTIGFYYIALVKYRTKPDRSSTQKDHIKVAVSSTRRPKQSESKV